MIKIAAIKFVKWLKLHALLVLHYQLHLVARLYNVPNWTKKKRAGRSPYMRYMSRIVTRSKNNV